MKKYADLDLDERLKVTHAICEELEAEAEQLATGTWPKQAPSFIDGNKVLHNVLGDYLVKNLNVCKINGALHIYDNGIYKRDDDILHGHMIQLVPNITDTKRREVYKYMKANLATPCKELSSPNLIPFKTKIFDIQTCKFIDYSPKYVFLNRFPYDYIPDAPVEKLVTETITQIADGDDEVVQLIDEAFGNCFYLLNSFRGAVMTYGNGSNGKSTLFNMLRQMLGKENTSSLSLQDTSERFRLAEVYGKAANIGDDMPDTYLPDSAIFKKLVTGEPVMAEKKGQDVFSFVSNAKMFFSMNKLPSVSDKSRAFFGRLLPIPLSRDFSQSPDIGLKERKWTQAEMEYLTKRAMDGLFTLQIRGGFIKPQKVLEALREYEISNNPVLEFLEEYGNIEWKPISATYSSFRIWCERTGHKKILTQTGFTIEASKITKTKSESIRSAGYKNTIRCFVPLSHTEML